MLTLACTRFSASTWEENQSYRERNHIRGCIYGTPRQIKSSCATNSRLFVLEMDNTNNKVLGIGLIRNTPLLDSVHRIYAEGNYNRYAYRGKYRIDRSAMTLREQRMLGVFDTLLFKGRKHCKFAQGITEVGSWIVNGPFDFIEYFKTVFNKHYPSIRW